MMPPWRSCGDGLKQNRKATEASGPCFLSGRRFTGQDLLPEAAHGLREVVRDGGCRAYVAAAEQHHHREHIVTVTKKVYQDGLIDPVDLSQHPSDAGTGDARAGGAARGEADLQRSVGAHLVLRRDAVQDADGSGGDGADVLARPVEQGADQPPAFQAVRPREGQPAVAALRIGLRVLQGLLAASAVADGEAAAAFFAAPRDDLAAFLVAHPRAEAVLIGAFAAAGLIGAFHDRAKKVYLEREQRRPIPVMAERSRRRVNF